MYAKIAAKGGCICTPLTPLNPPLCRMTTSFVLITSGLQVPLAAVDSLYYGRFVLAPLNILWYNVFRRGGGPDLYGKVTSYP